MPVWLLAAIIVLPGVIVVTQPYVGLWVLGVVYFGVAFSLTLAYAVWYRRVRLG